MLHCYRKILSLCILSFLAGCTYTYQEQPPTNLSCNPYLNKELRLKCAVRGPAQLAFSIVWYWEPMNINNRQPQHLSHTSKYDFRPNSVVDSNSRTHKSLLRVLHLNDNDTGWYFCRGNLPNGTLLTPSNKFLLDMKSAYTNDSLRNSTCPDQAQTTRVPSCANITNGTSTVGTTAPALVTGGTDPPSSSPTANTHRPSLHTTVNLAPTPTVTPVSTPESNMLQVALYAVISVIVVFCAVIVTLAVTIVILYRRKRGHANFKKTAGLLWPLTITVTMEMCVSMVAVCVYLSTR